MIKEAEAHADDDRKRREAAEAPPTTKEGEIDMMAHWLQLYGD